MPAQFYFTAVRAPARYPALAPGPDALPTSGQQRRCLNLLLVVGIGLRLFHFFYNRSFFIDELFLNVNVLRLGFWELATLPFAYEQKAPLGYLWAVKVLAMVFGNGEQSLRLFSLLGGISSLFLFRAVTRYFLASWGAVAALAILVFSTPCLYHSVEAKQYGTELLATIVALWLYVRYHARLDIGSRLRWGALGSVLLWFSFSLIFVLAGLGLAVSLNALLRRQWKRLLRYALPFSLWVLSFGLQYVLIISRYHQSGWLIDYFEKVYDGFLPFPLTALADAKWLAHKLYILLLNPLGLLLNTDELPPVLSNTPCASW
ncbi:ArnT family glycosyltransferase [Hymenobacter cellulosilyticus]|uniref:Glycosyltransferase RgtA/B/C/D-like domain-containing protein n=1 Tax=Hymenobacter cellulosilyticus TaxID=2932248 RepID=A0A8T9Q5A9_9BACT|nr:glycosyltransferase family 39 protein [Hymenobacter cellulosilyticus]UOQ70659.1 hypothetical protein MUN79_18375 [Hymenobacter cellulosilyticus]